MPSFWMQLAASKVDVFMMAAKKTGHDEITVNSEIKEVIILDDYLIEYEGMGGVNVIKIRPWNIAIFRREFMDCTDLWLEYERGV
jgi:hypothetical protein